MPDAELLQALVAIPSPTGSEAAAVAFLREQARLDGFAVLDDAVGNFVAETGTGPLLLFVGHVDTVPGRIPVRVEDGVLWGRGSVDAKGPLVAAFCAARRHLRSGIRIRLVGAIDEEGNSRGAKAVPTNLDPAWILIGEPSGVHGLTLGYKGIVRGAFHLERPHHHGAHAGPTAVEEAWAIWAAAGRELAFADAFDALQGHATGMDTRSDGLTDHAELRVNLRLPPGTACRDVQARLEALASAAGARFAVDETVEPALASKRTDLVAHVLHAIRASGAQPRLLRKTGTADFNLFAARHPGVPLAAYGPGDAALDHTPDERLPLADFAAAVAILDRVLGALAAHGPASRPGQGLTGRDLPGADKVSPNPPAP